jgi:hypothetical protein
MLSAYAVGWALLDRLRPAISQHTRRKTALGLPAIWGSVARDKPMMRWDPPDPRPARADTDPPLGRPGAFWAAASAGKLPGTRASV